MKLFKRRRGGGTKAEVPNASMSDIAFLLLIFFMVTTSFTIDKTPVDLPKTMARTEIPKNHEVVSIQKNGFIQYHGERVMMADIQPLASMEIAKDPDQIFLLKVDKGVRWELVDELLEQLRQARARNLSLPTEQEVN
ncbi:biopolymer transporter ExbD [bacterium]|nr:biopolymer transporter ExbD [candidate division CSSED10-310 bacterium]